MAVSSRISKNSHDASELSAGLVRITVGVFTVHEAVAVVVAPVVAVFVKESAIAAVEAIAIGVETVYEIVPVVVLLVIAKLQPRPLVEAHACGSTISRFGVYEEALERL